jgi:hypothetical protein
MNIRPGLLIYNDESMMRLREADGPVLGCNFNPCRQPAQTKIPTGVGEVSQA